MLPSQHVWAYYKVARLSNAVRREANGLTSPTVGSTKHRSRPLQTGPFFILFSPLNQSLTDHRNVVTQYALCYANGFHKGLMSRLIKFKGGELATDPLVIPVSQVVPPRSSFLASLLKLDIRRKRLRPARSNQNIVQSQKR